MLVDLLTEPVRTGELRPDLRIRPGIVTRDPGVGIVDDVMARDVLVNDMSGVHLAEKRRELRRDFEPPLEIRADPGFDPTVISDGQTIKAKQIEFSPKAGTAKASGSVIAVTAAMAGKMASRPARSPISPYSTGAAALDPLTRV